MKIKRIKFQNYTVFEDSRINYKDKFISAIFECERFDIFS